MNNGKVWEEQTDGVCGLRKEACRFTKLLIFFNNLIYLIISIIMQGYIVHKWIPHHPDPVQRSIVERTILLVRIGDKYVPISDQGVSFLDNNVSLTDQ